MSIAYGDLAIAVCDRCNEKKPYKVLQPDGNSPGLRVCPECWDSKDPYRFAPAQPDAITLEKPRPDVTLEDDAPYQVIATDGTILASY